MERHRDIRRGNMAAAAAANGLSRRRQRSSASTTTSNSFRDSPDDGTIELQETSRLRDRAGKKERDRLNRNKRRRGERLMLGGHRDDGGEESTEDSIDDDDDDEDDESSHIRMRPPNPASSSAHSNHHLHRKSYPPPAAAASNNKVLRATTWRVSDEMSFSVPKKARSACTKRTHESYISVVGGVSSGGISGGGVGGGGTGELIHRQASTSPARPSPAPTPAPASPSSSTASIRKKMKPLGAKPKHKPPKPSPIQDDIEIEVAEVLYGLMRQNQCSSRQESVANSSPKPDSREANGSANDAKSRVSSPISAPTLQSKLPPNSSSTTTPVSAVAPKRKRPRPVKFEDENSANFSNRNDSMSSNKIESELPSKTEASSTKLEKNSGSNESRTGVALDFGSSQTTIAPMDVQEELKTNSNLITESKPPVAEESVVRADDQTNNMVTSPKKESPCSKVDFNPENATATKATPTSASESHREEIFKIDLMAPPSKSSPEREGEVGFASESKPMASDCEMLQKLEAGELKENVDVNCKKDVEAGVVRFDKKTEKATTTVDECESQKPIVQKHTMLDLQIDPPKDNKDCGPSAVRQQQLHTLQQPSKPIRHEPKLELASGAQSASSVPLPMGVTGGWPGGLTPMGNGMGQIRPMLTSLDGTPGLPNTTTQPPQQPPTQTRPKRCATHYYIARNIYYHQQFTKMTPFWPAAAGSASMYGNKPYNLNAMPPTENASVGNPPLSGNVKHSSSIQDKGQAEGVKDKSTVAANFLDSSQGKVVPKQMVLQQPPQQLPIQGPALIFPMNQQQAAVASVSKNGAAKASNTVNASPSISVQSAVGAPSNVSASATGPGTMSFSYPNMPGNEAQYVAILQNNGYQFPVPAHVGAPSSYRGTTPPAMPFYNGPFYSSQMMQLQQQQQQQQMQQSHSQQQQPNQQGHQNASTSSGSSSSQKHQQHNHHQRLQGSGSNAASGTSNSFPASKNRPQKQQNQSFPVTHQQVRHHDTDVAVEDGHSQEDNRLSLANKNAYSHNFAMPAHTKNFTSLSPAPIASGNGNHSDRQQQHHQSSKGGAESTPNQTFAMPFTSFNGATTISGLDFSSMAQNHVIFQSLPDAARHGYQIAAAAAQTAQQKKNHQISEEGKAVNDSNNADDERKAPAGKGQPSGAQAIVFSRTDASDPSVSTILGNTVVESSARTLNLISSSGNGNRNSRSNTSTSVAPSTATVNASYSQQQQQQQQQQKQMGQLIQMQQMQQIQLIRQQQMHQIAAAAAARGKPSATNSANVYTDSLSSSSPIAAKFSNAHYYPEGLIQGGSSTQSPQWKNTRTAASSSSSPSLASAASSHKNLPQQQGRVQQGHTQISFGVNSKSGNAQHVHQIPTGNQSPSSPVIVGSPPTSVSKSAGGSPRASSTGNKMISAPSLSSQQQAKTSSSGPSRKSSPVGGRNPPSNLGNSHMTPAPCSTTKSSQSHHQQALHQQQQQQQQKQALHQAQLFFSSPYMQAQSPQSNSSTGNTTGPPNSVYYQQRRQPPEQQQQQQQLTSNMPSSGMLTLCPLTLTSTTSDPTKAVAAANAANMKGGLPPPGLIHAAQFATQSGGHPYMSTAFPYIHSVPSVQVKSGEQKQPTGNDNLH